MALVENPTSWFRPDKITFLPRLIDEIQLTQEQMSERVGKNAQPLPIIYAF
jgi:hypothetical protein